MTSVPRLTLGDDLNRVQANIIPPLNALLALPLLDGRLLDTETDSNGNEIAILITTTARNISHKLGRAYRGWFLTDCDAVARVHVDPVVAGVDPNIDHTKFLRLVATTDVNIKLWVF